MSAGAGYLEELIQRYEELVEEGKEEGVVDYWDAADWAQQDAFEVILRQLKELQNLPW